MKMHQQPKGGGGNCQCHQHTELRFRVNELTRRTINAPRSCMYVCKCSCAMKKRRLYTYSTRLQQWYGKSIKKKINYTIAPFAKER